MFSSADRELSGSSIRRRKARRWWRAKSQLKSAVRAPPTCRWPVGLGANRTRTGAAMSVFLEEPAPRRAGESPDTRAADGRIPEQVVIDVRGERRPDHERRMQEKPLERPQGAAADQLITPDHEAPTGLEAHRGGREVRVAHDLDLPGIRHTEPALLAHPQIRDLQRVKAHDLRGDRVDRDLIGGSEDHV